MNITLTVAATILILANLAGVVVQMRKWVAKGRLTDTEQGYVFIHLGFGLPLLVLVTPVIRADTTASMTAVIMGFALAFFGMYRLYVGKNNGA